MFEHRTLAGALYQSVMAFKYSFFSYSRILEVGCCYHDLVILSFLAFSFKLVASWSPDASPFILPLYKAERGKE